MSDFQRAVNLVKGYVNREWERINAVELRDAREELDQIPNYPRASGQTAPEEPTVIVRDASHARRILGVGEGATYDEIKIAYEKLSEMSKVDQFTTGTVEHSRAVRIQRSIHTAYTTLIEEFSTTERRFKSLEID